MINTKTNNVKKNFIYNTINQIFSIVTPLVTTPYISRILGADNIGKYSFAYTVAFYFSIFIIWGLYNYGNRTIASVRDNKELLSITFAEIYAFQLLCGIFITILYCIYTVYNNNIITWIMIMYVASNMFDINWFFYGLEEFRITVTRNIFIKLLTMLSVFCMVKTQADLNIYCIIMSGGTLISQLAVWPFVKKQVFIKRPKFRGMIKHICPNLTLFIPSIAISLYKGMDKVMLGILCSEEQLGFYEASEKIVNLPMAFVASLGTVMLPRMSNLRTLGNIQKTKEIMEKSIMFALFIGCSMCFGIMGIADQLVPLYYGNSFKQCIILFRILLPSCIFLSFNNVIRSQYIVPFEKDRIYIESVIMGAVLNLFANLFFIPMYQSSGAAIGTFIAESTVCIWTAYRIRKDIDIYKCVKLALPFVISGVLMYGLLISINFSLSSMIMIIIFKVIIGASFYLLVIAIYFKFKNR